MCIFQQVTVTFGKTDPAQLTALYHEIQRLRQQHGTRASENSAQYSVEEEGGEHVTGDYHHHSRPGRNTAEG